MTIDEQMARLEVSLYELRHTPWWKRSRYEVRDQIDRIRRLAGAIRIQLERESQR